MAVDVDIEQAQLPDADLAFRPGVPKLGWVGLLLFPVAIIVYLIAMPFFALFWLIEWLLPLRPAARQGLPMEEPAAALRRLPKDSPFR